MALPLQEPAVSWMMVADLYCTLLVPKMESELSRFKMQKPLFAISLSHSTSEDARLQKVPSFPSITEAFLEVPPQPIYFPTSKCHMDMLPRQEQAKLAACPGSSIITGSSGKSGKHTVAGARAVLGIKVSSIGVHQNPMQLVQQLPIIQHG